MVKTSTICILGTNLVRWKCCTSQAKQLYYSDSSRNHEKPMIHGEPVFHWIGMLPWLVYFLCTLTSLDLGAEVHLIILMTHNLSAALFQIYFTRPERLLPQETWPGPPGTETPQDPSDQSNLLKRRKTDSSDGSLTGQPASRSPLCFYNTWDIQVQVYEM
jgi:hypothetical protein